MQQAEIERSKSLKPMRRKLSQCSASAVQCSLDERVEELAVGDAAVEVHIELGEQVVEVLRGERVGPQLELEHAHEVGRLEEAVVVRVQLLERRPQAPELPQQLSEREQSERSERAIETCTRTLLKRATDSEQHVHCTSSGWAGT